ncbi:MAG: endonuclease domain-containing protein [Candidatus Methylacidiphilales bacterium]|nr:DUF559 domain-containing protein [Candidatus Methylacidiphilales bacterium]
MDDFLVSFIGKLQAGHAKALGARNPFLTLAQIEEYTEDCLPTMRAIGLRLSSSSGHDDVIEECVSGLASAALSLWPDWYNANMETGKASSFPAGVSQIWSKKARLLASVGKIPLPEGYTRAFQVEQMSYLLQQPELITCIATRDSPTASAQIQSLIATTAWLAEHSRGRTILIVPQEALHSKEFDRISKESMVPAEEISISNAERELSETPKVTITSIKGRPNPTSQGELLLAKHLGKDKKLSKLFSYNQTLYSIHDKKYRVDLVWAEGKLVIEVDGYYYHWSPHSFRQDRHRDYELLISGYRVLRLTHEEVMKDVTLAVAKVRDSVLFIEKTLTHGA